MTLKWKHKRTPVLLVAVILGMSSVFIHKSVLPIDGLGSPPPFPPIPGQEVSLDQAQASVPFKIGLPTNMGPFAELKLLQPPWTITPQVFVIYAAQKPSIDATLDDVKKQGGVIIIETPSNLTLQQAANNIRAEIDWSKGFPYGWLNEVNINGYVGDAGGMVGHGVHWYTETTYYEMQANVNYPVQQLVEIAQSIPVTGQRIKTDLNMDGKVNIQDITIVAVAFGSKAGYSNWNPMADVNNDGVVNIMDTSIVAKDYGRVITQSKKS